MKFLYTVSARQRKLDSVTKDAQRRASAVTVLILHKKIRDNQLKLFTKQLG